MIMEVIVRKLGNYGKVSAPKGYYALNVNDNTIIKTTMVMWTSVDDIKAQWCVITTEEKAEIEALREEGQPEDGEG